MKIHLNKNEFHFLELLDSRPEQEAIALIDLLNDENEFVCDGSFKWQLINNMTTKHYYDCSKGYKHKLVANSYEKAIS